MTRFSGGYLRLKAKLAKLESSRDNVMLGKALFDYVIHGPDSVPKGLRAQVDRWYKTCEAMRLSVPKPKEQ